VIIMWSMGVIPYMLILVLQYNFVKAELADEVVADDDDPSAISNIWENVVVQKRQLGIGRSVMDDHANLIGGDILHDPDEPDPTLVNLMLGRMDDPAQRRPPIPMFNWHLKVWMTRDIPYIIKPSSNKDRRVILSGMARLKEVSCLNFRKKKSNDKWWLEFFYGVGCYSGIGKKYWKTGPTVISIGLNCNYKDIVMHEVLHALGFAHEQSRTDRDKHVKIKMGNVIQGFASNFKKKKLTEGFYFGTPYDVESIMHYGNSAFSKGKGRTTIEKLNNPKEKLGGKKLSRWDIEELNQMYQCKARDGWSPWINTPCLCDSAKRFCTRSTVRMCLGKKACPGSKQQFGAQHKSTYCKRSEEGVMEGSTKWSSWTSYSRCDSKCGWGFQTRTRRRLRNNKNEVDRKAKLCREKRCSGLSFGDSGEKFTKWSRTRFSVKKGGYTSATGKSGYLKSIYFSGLKCIMFKYKTRSSSVSVSEVFPSSAKRKSKKLFSTRRGTVSTWKLAAVTVPTSKFRHRIVIKGSSSKSRSNFASISDIFVDNIDIRSKWKKCPPGLNVCRDEPVTMKDPKKRTECKRRGGQGECNHPNAALRRLMYHECCATCQEQSYRNKILCKNQNSRCEEWARNGQCTLNSNWMLANCAPSCGRCTAAKCEDKNKQCKTWAGKGECKKNSNWMSNNCAKSCRQC